MSLTQLPDKRVPAKTSGPSGEHLKYLPVELFATPTHTFKAWKHVDAVKFECQPIYQARYTWLDPASQLLNYFPAQRPVLDDAWACAGRQPKKDCHYFHGESGYKETHREWLPVGGVN